MADRLGALDVAGLDEALVAGLVARHERESRPRLERLWSHYRNAPEPVAGVGMRLAQERGLPARLRLRASDTTLDDRITPRREIVIENDIAWRVQTMIDFMFGKPVRIASGAPDEALRDSIERVLDMAWESSGGIALLQDMALLGHVYGHVDLALRVDEERLLASARIAGEHARLREAASSLRVELVDPTRGIAVLDPSDYRRIEAYIVHVRRARRGPGDGDGRAPGIARRAMERLGHAIGGAHGAVWTGVTEVITPAGSVVFEDGRVTGERAQRLLGDELPIAHIQNTSEPMRYGGLSEVEPLIPLQNELNTRLSDRACRVTMQCFKMYLARGIDGFEKVPVGPGRVWSTDNPDASIEAFGGDAASPSEDAHIREIRDAMDKQSGVPPIASGVVQAKIGNLSSSNALRITLMGVLSKTARKRVTYGAGIKRICGLMLAALDASGALRAAPEDRGVLLEWPDPLPDDLRERVAVAEVKAQLGADPRRVLEDLGHGRGDPGIE